MKKQSAKVDPQLLLNGARENNYDVPAGETVEAKSVAETIEETEGKHEGVAGQSVIPEASHVAEPKEGTKAVMSDKPKKERTRRMSHRDIFVKNTTFKARKGRQAYMREEFYEQIQKIVEVVGNRQVSVASYLDNVLAYHFETFGSEITAELNEGFNSSYNSNIKYEF